MSEEAEQEKVAEIRRDYTKQALIESVVKETPVEQFRVWFKQAVSAGMLDPNAMTLATATKNGAPSSRIVLLKGFDEQGFRFYSNYDSRKGRELEENPRAALCFFWPTLERQVRIEGTVQKVNRTTSADYFRQRPRLSQLGARSEERRVGKECRSGWWRTQQKRQQRGDEMEA